MKNTFYKMSEVTGRSYNVFSTVKILNIRQAIFYMQRGGVLYDLQISEDRGSGKPVFVFVFDREETKEAYDAWCRNRQVTGDGTDGGL